MRLLKLRRTRACSPPLSHTLALGVVFQDARIAIAVRDIDAPVRSKRDVAGSFRSALARGLLANGNLHELLAFRRKFQDHGTPRIDRPDIALRVDTDAVR